VKGGVDLESVSSIPVSPLLDQAVTIEKSSTLKLMWHVVRAQMTYSCAVLMLPSIKLLSL
jgi:hypothetical protein